MSDIVKDVTSIGMAIIGVAIIALLVKNGSGTAQVIGSMASGFGNSLLAAESGGSIAPHFGGN